jgi:glycosyltransferase involved in cell wall biosynthesis
MVTDHLSYNDKMHGVGRYFLNIIPFINTNKYNVILCVLRKKDALSELFISKKIRIIYFGKTKFDPSTFTTLLKLIKKENILHLHQYGSSNFGRLVGLITGIPVIIHSHDTDINYTLYLKIIDFIMAPFTDKAIAVSEGARRSTIKNRSIREDKVIVMHNAIPLGEFNVLTHEQKENEKKKIGIDPDYKIIGTITRLRVEKGNKYFIEAASEVLKIFPRTKFLIVGDGPLRDELQQFCKNLDIEDNVIFYGFSSNVQRLYSIFDITVIASVIEAFSFSIIEAMAMERAIISTCTEGPKEILINGDTGLLVPIKDSKLMAQKIIYLLENDTEIERLGGNAKKESRKYDIILYARKLEKEYENLVSSKS